MANSILLGVGLAMDAFSVSLANGMRRPSMKRLQKLGVAGVFAFFQFLMPMIGWLCVHAAVSRFAILWRVVPWIAWALLCWIGIQMLLDAYKKKQADAAAGILLLQGIATSLDALSVGFAAASYSRQEAIISALIIAAVTFAICRAGIAIGIRFGTRFANASTVLGGCILIVIGFEILLRAHG